MLIVLEGPDGSGKTTFANTLAAILNAEVIHESAPEKMDHYLSIINQAHYRNIIADRFFWGQFVYQEEKDRKMSPGELGALEHDLYESRGKIIYVTADKADINKRLWSRGEKLSLPLDTLLERYNQMVHFCYCPVLVYNTSTNKMEGGR